MRTIGQDVAFNLRRVRRAKGLTLEEVAARYGCSKQAIGGWEQGQVSIGTGVISRLADALGVFYMELLAPVEFCPTCGQALQRPKAEGD